ncbi:ribosomal small subunit assembly protein [Aspergillus pseudoustus]|uniref:Ribosomal small subunit assembly protein n=1 Tax=Aspergillus pseudoustus TaxID=1810923 RepID=A0ABR4IWZ0_9EURO
MKKDLEISGYTVLPLQLPTTPAFSTPATHYLYLRPHEPRIPDLDTPRSLFLVNLPIDTTETHLRHLFSTQLASGRIERVEFESARAGKKSGAAQIALLQGTNVAKGSNKKRKRVTADELENRLDDVSLPSTWDGQLQRSGSHAVVIFVDNASMETSLKAARKAAKKTSSNAIIWGEGLDEAKTPTLGLQRYVAHQRACYPPRADLLRKVNEYMNVFMEVAEARKREAVRRAAEPDEDGFITVTSGPKLTSAAGEEEAKRLIEKQKKKQEGFGDFYRFQSREKRKERQIELLKKFDEDKKKLEEMKLRKGKIRSGILAISRRHAKKFSSAFEQPPSGAQERGYESFNEVARDVESLVDVLWVSGTPSLQIPYLISLSVLVNTYLPDYPFTAKPTFRLLRKLDSFFASLILGEDAESGQPLSGFEVRRNIVSMTEKVRVKSIAETARVVVVEAGENGGAGQDVDGFDEDEDDDESEGEMDVDGFRLDETPGKWEMETARVYEKTIQLLGDELGKAGEFCDENMARGEEADEQNDLVMNP